MHVQHAGEGDYSCGVCDSQSVSRFLDVCLRLPPAAIGVHAGSRLIVTLVTIASIIIEIDCPVEYLKTCAAKRVSSNVCCYLSVFWSR